MVDGSPLGLLVGHVGRRAHDGSGRRQVPVALERPGEAEVQHLEPTALALQ